MKPRWTAPEALLINGTLKFSEASDVWSFGCTLLEIFNEGNAPYYKLQNDVFLKNINNQFFSTWFMQPDNNPNSCPPHLWKEYVQCFNFNPETRPTFKNLRVLTDTYRDSKISSNDSKPIVEQLQQESSSGPTYVPIGRGEAQEALAKAKATGMYATQESPSDQTYVPIGSAEAQEALAKAQATGMYALTESSAPETVVQDPAAREAEGENISVVNVEGQSAIESHTRRDRTFGAQQVSTVENPDCDNISTIKNEKDCNECNNAFWNAKTNACNEGF